MNLEQIRVKLNSGTERSPEIRLVVACSGDSRELVDRLKRLVADSRLEAAVVAAGSQGYPDLEPLVLLERPGQPGVIYPRVNPETAAVLAGDCLEGKDLHAELALGTIGEGSIEGIAPLANLPLFSLQKRAVLRHCGYIDPASLAECILRAGGYSGLARALEMTPEAVVSEIAAAGLKGRGGAGYSTADKWNICRTAEDQERYIICNAMDSDPLSGIARLILEGNPHIVLEGLLIGAYATGACACYLCAGEENRLALERLNKALEQMRQYGLLGSNILDSGFSCDINVKEIPSCLVAGEETALIRALENKQAKPFIRPPYPAAAGLHNRPTVVNHLETLANAALILQKAPDGSGRTKIVTVCGDVAHRNTLEVPLGTSLFTIIERSGGAAIGKDIRSVQVGGPAGAFLAAGSLELPLDFESLAQAGAIMGSGTIEVFSRERCMVRTAAEKTAYLHEQSCGKCVFCREGTLQTADLLADLEKCRGKSQDLEMMLKLGQLMQQGSICGLGKNAPSPMLSSLELFRDDYEAHLKGENGCCRCHSNGKPG